MSDATRQFAVVGNPIDHSQSPRIHRAFAEQTGIDLEYRALLAGIDAFTATVEDFFAHPESLGLNVTLPFKQDAAKLADTLSDRGRSAGAVNTLKRLEDGTLYGDNTDGLGLLQDLASAGWEIEGRRVLILGAGGAVRGVMAPLLEARPSQAVVANRTVDKAVALVAQLAQDDRLRACAYTDLHGEQYDLIINGTSASLSGGIPPLPSGLFGDRGVAYDMMYGREPTAFLRWASDHGAHATRDGLGMLVEQAAASFELWLGVRPETRPVLDSVRRALGEG